MKYWAGSWKFRKISRWVAHVPGWFWGSSRHPNCAHDSSLESPGCLLSNPSGTSEFGVDLTLQNLILPKVLPAGAKGDSKVVFKVFLSFLTIQNLMKCFGNAWGCITYHEKSKNVKISFSKCPKKKWAYGCETHLTENPVFRPKNFKMTKFSPNLLKFGAKILHHVSCPANEASAKIRSGSGLFRRFSASRNLLFKIFILALQTCMRAQ